MFSQLVTKLTTFFIENNIIEKKEEEVYSYSLKLLLAVMRDCVFLIIVGAVTGTLAYTFFFMLGLFPMRSFVGGYHAESHFKCFLTFAVIYLLFIIVLKSISMDTLTSLNFCLFGISALIIILVAPVDHKNKPLDKLKKRTLKIKSYIFLGGYAIVIFLDLSFFQNKNLLFSLILGLFVASISCLVAWLQKINKTQRGEKNV